MKRPKYRKIKTVTIHGKRYAVKWRRPHPAPTQGERAQGVDGKCDCFKTPNKAIYIHPNKDPWVLAEIVAHEMLHGGGEGWALAEAMVEGYTHDLMLFLRRMGAKLTFE